jgi:hypothetical protein
MTRTRYFAVFVAALCAFLLHAAVQMPPPPSSFFVTLTANPPGHVNWGSSVALTAAARWVKPGPKPGIPAPPKLTYAYQARHIWPCQELIPIPGSGTNATWTPLKGGDYQLVVVGTRMVKASGGGRPETATSDPVPYHVDNQGQIGNLVWNFYPPNGTSPPPPSVSVTITLPSQPVPGYSYRLKLACQHSIGTATCSVTNPLVQISNPATWSVNLSGAGQVMFQTAIDVIGPDCTVVSASPYNFYNFQ